MFCFIGAVVGIPSALQITSTSIPSKIRRVCLLDYFILCIFHVIIIVVVSVVIIQRVNPPLIISKSRVLRTLQHDGVHDWTIATVVVQHTVDRYVSPTCVEAQGGNAMGVNVDKLVILPIPALVVQVE